LRNGQARYGSTLRGLATGDLTRRSTGGTHCDEVTRKLRAHCEQQLPRLE